MLNIEERFFESVRKSCQFTAALGGHAMAAALKMQAMCCTRHEPSQHLCLQKLRIVCEQRRFCVGGVRKLLFITAGKSRASGEDVRTSLKHQ
jgi:hypothetical protein